MAKSLRSKFKRKVRAIARTKKQPKTDAFLQKAIEKRDEYEKVEAGEDKILRVTSKQSFFSEKAKAEGTDGGDKMDVTGEAATINTKPLRKKDGSFPSWLSGTQKKKATKKSKAIKKSKNKSAKNFR
ncbi:hypothetical protein B9Z55_014848 [Caenorhabditis nigoni]|uniref:Uncharacterized protein n=1 Tax=Caenorhabditis nigoni TaxID=1611254 RepID=A0A2G5U7S4_9PELO|nr:hypothetical protein B9Z55_014848 [Caenorhabditis nigoni]